MKSIIAETVKYLNEGKKLVGDEYSIKITVKTPGNAKKLDDYIQSNSHHYDLEDIDDDSIHGGNGYMKGVVYIQGEEAGEFGKDIQKDLKSGVKVESDD